MATIPQNQSLCDYCHQKPKFGNHAYCGKTCSQQAAAINQTNAAAYPQPQTTSTLCKQCNQRPKFQNFEFCGKSCASTWQLAYGGSSGNPNPAGNVAGQTTANKLLGKIPQPLQAKLQAVLPGVAAALQQPGHKNTQQPQQPPTNVNLNANNAAPVPPSNFPQQSTLAPNNPNANLPQQSGGPGPGANNNAIPTSVPGQVQTAMPTTCRLTGCGNPVYTDATYNHTSEYCSKRHREEAVTTGQVQPCIMCLKMPRSNADHFCSKVCREGALSQ